MYSIIFFSDRSSDFCSFNPLLPNMSIFNFYFVSSVNPILNFNIVSISFTNEVVKSKLTVKFADYYFCTLCTNGLNWRYIGIRREKNDGVFPRREVFQEVFFFAGDVEPTHCKGLGMSLDIN